MYTKTTFLNEHFWHFPDCNNKIVQSKKWHIHCLNIEEQFLHGIFHKMKIIVISTCLNMFSKKVFI